MDSLWSNLFRRRHEGDALRRLLRDVPLFEHLADKELAEVEAILYRRTYRQGETVFRQGDPGVGMYIVAEGVVSIRYEPTDLELARLGEGDFFGEIALLNETPRSATARAETECVLLGFFQPDLLDLVERQPRLGVKVLLPLAQITGQRLLRADQEKELLRATLERRGEPPALELPL